MNARGERVELRAMTTADAGALWFEKMRLHKITLTVVTENEAAHHIYRKVGFVEEGRWLDHFTMSLLEGELR